MSLVEQKSQLAKLLATENVVIQHKKVQTASFNPTTRVLTCPIWKDMSPELYDLLMSHEVGHALNTPADGWHGAVSKNGRNYKNFLNVIEDARIEKRIKRRYPGLVKSYIKGFNDLLDMNIFGVQDIEEINELSFINRINLFTKSSYSMPIQFSNEESLIIDEIKKLESWEDVIAMTDRLWDQAVEEQEQDQTTMFDYTDIEEAGDEDSSGKSDQTGFSPNDDSDNEDESEDQLEEIESDEDEDSKVSSDSNSNENEDESEKENEKDSEDQGVSPHGAVDGHEKHEPTCETDESFRENESQLLSESSKDNIYIDIPKPRLERILEDTVTVNKGMTKFYDEIATRGDGFWHFNIKRNLIEVSEAKKLFSRSHVLNEFKKKNDRFISLMAKDFEMKKAATKYAKARLYTSGDIDVNKIYKYKFDDQIFRKLTKLPKGKNHGMILVLDLSGSMDRNMAGSIEQIAILTAFCKKVQIPFRVFGFTSRPIKSSYDGYSDESTDKWYVTEGSLALDDDWSLREFINSDMGAAAYKNALENLLLGKSSYNYSTLNVGYGLIPDELGLSSTPLNEAIVALGTIIPEFRQKNNLDIVNTIFVHDGDSNWSQSYNTWYDPEVVGDKYTLKAHWRTIGARNSDYNFVIQDKKVRFSSIVKIDRNNNITNDLLEWLKAKTGSQIFGFFVSTRMTDAINYRYVPKDSKNVNFYRAPWEEKEAVKKIARKQKFIESNNRGFDQFYILNDSNKLTTDDEEFEFEVNNKKSINTRSLASQFTKMNRTRSVNRILATKFVEKIAVKL